MKKFIFAIIAILLTSYLYSFFPSEKSFASDYQYSLYRSWLKKNKVRSRGRASFSKNIITVKYLRENKEVIFFLKNRKIISMGVKLDDDYNKYPINKLSSEFIFRLNCADSFFLYDFLDKQNATFIYKNKTKDKAVYNFLQNYKDRTFYPLSISYKMKKVIFHSKDDTVAVIFNNISSDISYQLPKRLKKREKNKINIKPQQKQHFSHDIFGYIKKNYRKIFHLEILNNKITSPASFITNDFPGYKISQKEDIFQLDTLPLFGRFYANLQVFAQKNENSLKFLPYIDYKFSNNYLKYKWGETIDFSKISQKEAKIIAPSITHLLFEHRALGKKLFNFLLINDAVPATLVLKNNASKELLEFQSYSSLLKLLNSYFQGNKVYFSISQIKKVNGYLEIFANLYTKKIKTEEKIFAEVRFQLDKKYKMKYVMMFLSKENTEN